MYPVNNAGIAKHEELRELCAHIFSHMNLRSVFAARSDAERLDEKDARDDGGSERDEQHSVSLSNPRSQGVT